VGGGEDQHGEARQGRRLQSGGTEEPDQRHELNERFRSAETVEQVRLDRRFFLLYEQGDALVFMDTESYEQLELQKDFVGDRSAFLQDGMMVTVQLYEESRSASSCLTR
jgi:translation elongation factor P/translation initiation factor 5A